MAEYAISTNLIGWIPGYLENPFVGWVRTEGEADVIEQMVIGDFIIPKFAQKFTFEDNESQPGFVDEICSELGANLELSRDHYNEVVNAKGNGNGAVPCVWQVTQMPELRPQMPGGWECVTVKRIDLDFPLATQEFLRFRGVPVSVAKTFKAVNTKGNRIQRVADGTAARMIEAGSSETRSFKYLKRLTLVKADDAAAASSLLTESGLGPQHEDLVFVSGGSSMSGYFEIDEQNQLAPTSDSGAFEKSVSSTLDLIVAAKAKALPNDKLSPRDAISALEELIEFHETPLQTREIQNFSYFYNGFVKLHGKVSFALEIVDRPPSPETNNQMSTSIEDDIVEDEDVNEDVVMEKLNGLTINSVQTQLDEVELPRQTVADAVTALRAGKHLLLSGPPGTGKSRLASAICRAVVDSGYDMATATADWTTFDTIGGYMPTDGGKLRFEAGVVLRALKLSNWLIVDEINRADIDKAFGPLFTILSGAGEHQGAGEDVVLPYREGDKAVRIVWSEGKTQVSQYSVAASWRMIGTLNVRDKTSLFQLSFAFLRRFAVIDVPLPGRQTYSSLVSNWLETEPGTSTDALIESSMSLAFGPRQLGPAILKDISTFTKRAMKDLEPSKTGPPYASAPEAFLAAVRLYAVPQYEGAEQKEVDQLLKSLEASLPAVPSAAWEQLKRSFSEVVLA